MCQPRKIKRDNETNDVKFLNSVFVIEKFANHLGDLLIFLETSGVAVPRCVDDGHRIRNAESIGVMDVISCDTARMTVHL